MNGAWFGAVTAVALLGSWTGCSAEPRQPSVIMLALGTDVPSEDIAKITIETDFGAGHDPQTLQVEGDTLPVLIPASMPDHAHEGTLHFRVVLKSKGDLEVHTEARAALQAHHTRLLKLWLLNSCGKCPESQRCDSGGSCVPLEEGDLTEPYSVDEQNALLAELELDASAALDAVVEDPGSTEDTGTEDADTDTDGNPACEPCVGSDCVVSLSLGANHACAVTTEGAMVCWGANDFGQLSDAADVGGKSLHSPRRVQGDGFKWQSVSAGRGLTCGLEASGLGYCWGKGIPVADQYPPETELRDLEIGLYGHGCGHRLLDGVEWCWLVFTEEVLGGPVSPILADPAGSGPDSRVIPGDNRTWLLGKDDVLYELQPPAVSSSNVYLVDVRDAAMKGAHCYVRLDRVLECEGRNDQGQAGQPVRDGANVPRAAVLSHLRFDAVANSEKATCALDENGTVWCWGDHTQGIVGEQTGDDAGTPLDVVYSLACDPYVDVQVGFGTACAQRESGAWDCWGGPPELPVSSDLANGIAHRLVIDLDD